MKKNKILAFIISVFLIVPMFFIKVGARTNYYTISTAGQYGFISYFNIAEENNSNIDLIIENTNEKIILNYNSSTNSFYVNNNSNYEILKGYNYCVQFINTLNRFTFYVLDYNNYGLNVSDWYATEIFNISLTTGSISSIDIYSIFFQKTTATYSYVSLSNITNQFYNEFYLSSYYVQLENAYNRRYSSGYGVGYNEGFNDGQEGKTDLNKVWDIIGGIFSVIGTVMAIELFPHVPIGIFFLIPLVFGAVGFIFWLYRRGN